ncbi:NAD(P)/FAD-dependent oxidoreductase [Novosphingobium sp. P6W]|uniref:FAD-dependent oxidoreductase n=1 Tax=Novosphingobium sp. P6W TaxID=1609758 RepID=UPI0005C2E935|nr:NAD(P)/FAD-dependent oxidoreductase [Novosphingobium sp. P6W]AXB75551.1 FAD-dependent monooxygenase [Novosphingobium sp. P6W]KIS30220.1 glutamate synthase [Novosphingobium sp. P6W]
MRGLNIAIAGCGPCGLAAALLLHRAGHHVTLFERFEAPQPIGSGLMIQPTGMAVLARLGLLDAVLARGARVDRLFGMAGKRVVLDVHYAALRRPDTFGIGIHRASLFAVLHEAVLRSGIPLNSGRTLAGSALLGSKRALRFADGQTSAPYDLVVDALGTRTPLAAPTGRELAYGALWASLDWPEGAGFDPHALAQRYDRASIMAGVLPIGTPPGATVPKAAFFWSLRADRLDDWREAGLAAWKAKVAALWPDCAALLGQITDPGQLTFARYAHRTLSSPAEPALVHIGDAWHSASPQLGQGANMALLDAWALARGLDQAESVDEGVRHGIRLRRRHVLTYQWLTALFTPVYQSDSRLLPLIRDRLVGPLSKLWPATAIQASMVSGLVGNPLRPLGLEDDLQMARPAVEAA